MGSPSAYTPPPFTVARVMEGAAAGLGAEPPPPPPPAPPPPPPPPPASLSETVLGETGLLAETLFGVTGVPMVIKVPLSPRVLYLASIFSTSNTPSFLRRSWISRLRPISMTAKSGISSSVIFSALACGTCRSLFFSNFAFTRRHTPFSPAEINTDLLFPVLLSMDVSSTFPSRIAISDSSSEIFLA